MLAWFLLAQSATANGPTLELPRLLPAKPDCSAERADELVVCGRTDAPSPYRLKPLPPGVEGPLLPRAETGLLGGRISVEGDQAGVGGFASRRAMVRMKWGF